MATLVIDERMFEGRRTRSWVMGYKGYILIFI